MQLISLYQTTIESHYFHKLNKVINLQRLIFWSGFLFQLWRLRHRRKTCALVRPILHGLVPLIVIIIYWSWFINLLTFIFICRSVWEERGVIARLLGGKLVHHLLTLSRLELFHLVCSFVWLFVCLFVNLSYFDCLLFTIYWYFQGLSSFLIVLPIYWTHEVGQIANQLWQMSNSP